MKFGEYLCEASAVKSVNVTSSVTNEYTEALAKKLGELKLNCEICGYESGYCVVYFPEIGYEVYIGDNLKWYQPTSAIGFKHIDEWLKILKAFKKLRVN